MKHLCKCKICKKEILITVDDDYAAMRDPMNILQMATCNKCFDQYATRERLHDGIYKAVCTLISGNQDVREKVKIILETLTKKYSRWLAECHNATPVWDSTLVELIMRNPTQWQSTLREYRIGYKKALKESVGV